MKVSPINSQITFKNSQPLKDDIKMSVRVGQPDGTEKTVLMDDEEYQKYMSEQIQKKEEKRKQEELQKQQEWLALINKPQGKYEFIG